MLTPEIFNRRGTGRVIVRVAELGEEPKATGADIGSRGVEQCAMISERDMVQVVMGIVGVEGAPTTISALHPDDPFRRTVDGPTIVGGIEAIQCKRD